MKQKPSILQRITTISIFVTVIAFIILAIGTAIHALHIVVPYARSIGFIAFGAYLMLNGVTKIRLSRSDERDILWYKRYNLTRGLAFLLFGLSYYVLISANLLPDTPRDIIDVSDLILFILSSGIMYIFSLKAPQPKTQAE